MSLVPGISPPTAFALALDLTLWKSTSKSTHSSKEKAISFTSGMYGSNLDNSGQWPSTNYPGSDKSHAKSASRAPKRCKWLRSGYGSKRNLNEYHAEWVGGNASKNSIDSNHAAVHSWGTLTPREPPASQLREYEHLAPHMRQAHYEHRDFQKRVAQGWYEHRLKSADTQVANTNTDKPLPPPPRSPPPRSPPPLPEISCPPAALQTHPDHNMVRRPGAPVSHEQPNAYWQRNEERQQAAKRARIRAEALTKLERRDPMDDSG